LLFDPPKLTGGGDLKMSKSHANAVSFDENKSHLSNLSNLCERNEHFLNETTVENTKNITVNALHA